VFKLDITVITGRNIVKATENRESLVTVCSSIYHVEDVCDGIELYHINQYTLKFRIIVTS